MNFFATLPLPNELYLLVNCLRRNDPRVVDTYLEHLHTAIEDVDLYQRMNSLHSRTVFPLPPHLAEEYEVIDLELCQCMDMAKARCRKFKMGAKKWSPAFKKARIALEH